MSSPIYLYIEQKFLLGNLPNIMQCDRLQGSRRPDTFAGSWLRGAESLQNSPTNTTSAKLDLDQCGDEGDKLATTTTSSAPFMRHLFSVIWENAYHAHYIGNCRRVCANSDSQILVDSLKSKPNSFARSRICDMHWSSTDLQITDLICTYSNKKGRSKSLWNALNIQFKIIFISLELFLMSRRIIL